MRRFPEGQDAALWGGGCAVGDARSPEYPDVPTFNEAGMADVRGDTWSDVFAASGPPDEIVARLESTRNAAIQTLRVPCVDGSRGQMGTGTGSADFQAFIGSEVAAHLQLRDQGGLKREP